MTNEWPIVIEDQLLYDAKDGELSPCPHCENPPIFKLHPFEGRVECSFCGAYGEWNESRALAATQWNERKNISRDERAGKK